MGNWISVNDRLPDKDDEFLVALHNPNGSWDEVIWRYDGVKWVEYDYDDRYLDTSCITHWMELPELPKRRMETRDILFRGRQFGNHEWVYGGLVKTSNGKYKIITESIRVYVVDPDTVCEYTGLIDKNGKQIFEGDIVRSNSIHQQDTFNRSIIGKVIYDCGSFAIDTGISTNYRWMDYDVEIIGNIYDNHELMEGESDA